MTAKLATNQRPDWVGYVPCAFVIGWWAYRMNLAVNSALGRWLFWTFIVGIGYVTWKQRRRESKGGAPAPLWFCLLLVLFAVPFLIAAGNAKDYLSSPLASELALGIGTTLYVAASILCFSGWKTLQRFIVPVAVFSIVPAVLFLSTLVHETLD